MRETYFPEVNDTELVTAYISPKAKDLQGRLRQPKVPLRAKVAATVLGRRHQTRTPLTAGQTFFRVIVAGGISLAAATLMIGVFNFLIGRMDVLGMGIPAAYHTVVLTYAYVIMFLFFFFSLFRSRLQLHRLLADLWKQSRGNADTAKLVLPKSKIKPKHDRVANGELARAQEDLKLKRGDLEMAPPTELVEQASPPTAVTQPVEPAKPELSTTEAKAAAEAAKIAAERAKAAAAKAAADAIEQKQQAEEAVAAEVAARKELERTIMRRFALDVIQNALRELPDDPVTRRGLALVLAGSATGLSASARETPATTMTLVSDVLHHAKLGDPAIDTFMDHYAEQVGAVANQSLINVGRVAVAHYLQGRADVGTVVSAALAAWRVPFPHAAPDVHAEPAPPPAPMPLREVYLLTELRTDGETEADDIAKDAAMGLHNGIVRTVLAENEGHEVKHTGTGIFARFASADAALHSADSMQSRLGSSGLKIAIGIIGNTDANEDPLLSPELFHRAQALTATTPPAKPSPNRRYKPNACLAKARTKVVRSPLPTRWSPKTRYFVENAGRLVAISARVAIRATHWDLRHP